MNMGVSAFGPENYTNGKEKVAAPIGLQRRIVNAAGSGSQHRWFKFSSNQENNVHDLYGGKANIIAFTAENCRVDKFSGR
jgi:hypothetical protein